MTKDFHKCEDCFDGITSEIMKGYKGCICPACLSLITDLIRRNGREEWE